MCVKYMVGETVPRTQERGGEGLEGQGDVLIGVLGAVTLIKRIGLSRSLEKLRTCQ